MGRVSLNFGRSSSKCEVIGGSADGRDVPGCRLTKGGPAQRSFMKLAFQSQPEIAIPTQSALRQEQPLKSLPIQFDQQLDPLDFPSELEAQLVPLIFG